MAKDMNAEAADILERSAAVLEEGLADPSLDGFTCDPELILKLRQQAQQLRSAESN